MKAQISSLIINDKDTLNIIGKALSYLKKKYGLEDENILKALAAPEKDIMVPVSVFAQGLSPLESLIKFLKENLEFNYHRIGKILARDERTIWFTYSNALKKKQEELTISDSGYSVPVTRFSKNRLSILETLCLYMAEEYRLEIRDIAKILKKHPSAIWTVYRRAQKKNEK